MKSLFGSAAILIFIVTIVMPAYALKIDRAHIAGFSPGGSAVAQLLAPHPERFLTGVPVAAAGRSPKEASDPRNEKNNAKPF